MKNIFCDSYLTIRKKDTISIFYIIIQILVNLFKFPNSQLHYQEEKAWGIW